jgi:hypothetical protein
MVSVITAVLAGSTASLIVVAAFDDALASALCAGLLVAVGVLWALTRYQHTAWTRADLEPFIASEEGSAR